MSTETLKSEVLDGQTTDTLARSLVLAGLILGGILAIAVFVYPSPFPQSLVGA